MFDRINSVYLNPSFNFYWGKVRSLDGYVCRARAKKNHFIYNVNLYNIDIHFNPLICQTFFFK